VSRGDEGLRVHALWYLAILEWFAGRWPRALENAGRAFELGEQTQFPQNRAWRGRVTALIEGDLGHIEEARTDVEEAIAWSRSTGNEVFRLLIVGVAGRIELALGDLRAAAGHLRDLPERLIAGGVNDPTNPAWADAIEVLVALGELERARTYLEHYERQALRLASPWARASSARCRGLLSAAGGDLAGGFEAFARALAELGEGPFPFEHGRTLLALGLVHRQANHKRAAREALEQAVGVFEELGAPLWAEKARAELRRISGRAAAPDELTESERRVAELAAVGRSNKEIAAELYMGLSTVEAHLSRVYRKLGVRSRAELAARSAAQS
jgi:DNA-binding CsgD family transcriptional regulator